MVLLKQKTSVDLALAMHVEYCSTSILHATSDAQRYKVLHIAAMDTKDLFMGHSLALVAFSALSFLALGLLLKQYLRLRRIPGPFLASLTDLWFVHEFWSGKGFGKITTDLHHKYGPVVRMGPNRVIFSNASAIPVIYRTTDVMPKVSRDRKLTGSSATRA